MAGMIPSNVLVAECVGCKDRVGFVGLNDLAIRDWRGLRKCDAPRYLGRNRNFLGWCQKCVTRYRVESEHMAPPIFTGGD
jgi:hypothetical protein